MRKLITLAALSVGLLGSTAAFADTRHERVERREVRQDRREIRNDRREVRQDRREIRNDRREIRREERVEHFRDYRVRPSARYESFRTIEGYRWHAGEWMWDGYEWVWTPGYYVSLNVRW